MANINGTSGSDRLVGTIFNDTIKGFNGNDVIIGSQGFDFIDGGNDFDTVNYTALSESIALKPAGEIDKGASGSDTLFLVERVIAPRNQLNIIDSSTASGGVSINASLRKSSLIVRNIPGLGKRSIKVNNFVDVVGTTQNDSIEGNADSNSLSGLGGNDVFIGTQGFDLINGGNGSDTVNYKSLTEAITLKPAGEIDKGSSGNDILFLVERVISPVSQFNLIDASTASGGVSINANLENKSLFVRNIPGLGTRKIRVDNFVDVIGTEAVDFIKGSNGDNFLSGLGGNDTFKATAGFDTVNGGDGFDTIDYSGLNTAITLEPAGAINKGGFGTDSLFRVERIVGTNNQSNSIDASSSNDASIEANLAGEFLNVSGIPGVGFLGLTVVNFANVIGSQQNDAITGSNKSNSIDGQNGDDFINATRGNDFINGGDGFDTIDYSNLNVAVTIKPAGVIQKGSSNGTDIAFRVENFIGAAGKTNTINGSTASAGVSFEVSLDTGSFDVLNVPGIGSINQFVQNFVNVTGTQSDDFVRGDGANNVLSGQSGDDDLFGGSGSDRLIGGSGNDFITGENGNDRINGTDSAARGRNEIDSLQGGAGNDRFALGDASGAFYKATSFPSSDFDSFGFGGFAQVAFISDFGFSDRLELGRGETYRAERTSGGFDLYVSNSGRFDAIAGVATTSFIGLPSNNFTISAGQSIGVFVGV